VSWVHKLITAEITVVSGITNTSKKWEWQARAADDGEGRNGVWLADLSGQQSVGLGMARAKTDPGKGRFCRIFRPTAPLWDKKKVKIGPLRPIRSRCFPSSTGW
jgi:hypothetical protein